MKPSQLSFWFVLKRALIIYIPLVILLLGVTFVIYNIEVKTEMIRMENNELHNLEQLKTTILNDFNMVTTDLLVVSEQMELVRMFNGNNEAQQNLEDEFLSISSTKKLYDQIRFLDESGMEIVRINFNNGVPIIVPSDQLQFKGERYYFEDTIRLNKNEIFVSPLDLNIEHGEIEVPLKPMIRFGTPVFDSSGNKKGIVLINYCGSIMLDDIQKESASSSGNIMFLNNEGFFLKGTGENEWGFMYEDGKNWTFGNMYPEEWQEIKNNDTGKFHNDDGLFLFETVYPLKEYHKSSTGAGRAFEPSEAYLKDSEYFWKLVIHVPSSALTAMPQRVLNRILILDGLFLVILLIGSVLYARTTIKRKIAEDELKEYSEHLKELVNERTAELSDANIVLKKEINERKEAEEALKKSEEMAISILESTPEGIVVIDEDFNITMVNNQVEDMLGYKKSELIGKSHNFLVPERFREKHFEHMEDFVSNPRLRPMGIRLEVTILKKNGEEMPIECSLSPVETPKGKIIISSIRDITERKEVERLRVENLGLGYASKAKSEFLANMSHELRTPLNSILGFSELLNQKIAGELNNKQEHYTENIHNSGTFLLGLINDILDISKVEAGKVELKIETIKLPSTIEETLTLVKEKALKHDIILETEYDPKLDVIEADKQRIKQVLFNLLSNAIKFSKLEGGTITITTKKEGKLAKISVSDTGIGIKKEDINRLFKEFQQLESPTTKQHQGTGLGLVISKKLVELHGGTISLESEYGVGSTFAFTVPIKAVKRKKKKNKENQDENKEEDK